MIRNEPGPSEVTVVALLFLYSDDLHPKTAATILRQAGLRE
jgi:hypothetical protein